MVREVWTSENVLNLVTSPPHAASTLPRPCSSPPFTWPLVCLKYAEFYQAAAVLAPAMSKQLDE
eukprot:1139022-Pelagomonas_calceolata.AAC.1